jgi:cardiolipin synthase (CMP-forming)
MQALSFLPNLLTLLRLACAPVLIAALAYERFPLAFVVFTLAGITDALDGFLAKRYGWTTRLGAALDPIADKVLLVSAYVMLAVLAEIPLWLLLLVAFRDLLIVGGFLLLMALGSRVQPSPSLISKLNTCVQIVLVVYVLAEASAWIGLPLARDALIVTVATTTVLSGAHYLWVWVLGSGARSLPREEGEP